MSTSATTLGLVAGLVAGKTADTAPATSVTASPPETRVVFFVAMLGKPSWAAESFESALTPLAGVPGLLGACAGADESFFEESSLSEQPPRRTTAASSGHSRERRGTGASVSGQS